MKLRSTALEKEIETAKAQKSAQKQNYAREKPGAKEVTTAKRTRLEEIVEIRDSQRTKSPQADMEITLTPQSFGTNARIRQPVETHKINSSQPSQPRQSQSGVSRKSYAQVVKENPMRSSLEKPWTEVRYTNKKNVAAKKGMQKQEPGGRRILFPRKEAEPKRSEEDIMLALNEALQKAGELATARFSRIGYSQSGAISALLTEKAGAKELLETRRNILIRAAKTVDAAVIGAEALEHWQRLKVHGMPLGRYLGEGKMELCEREVESSTGIQLKINPRWLIHESRLRERQESGNYCGSSIVIIVANNSNATYLCARGLRFGEALKVIERYWEAGPGSVCPVCCGISHDCLGKCGQRPVQCTLCAGPHKLEEHKCGVNGCEAGFGKICTHVTAVCANCKGSHQSTSGKCPARQQAEKKARKKKVV